MSIGETERTLEEIKDVGKDATLYRAIGSVMKKIEDPKQLKKDLTEEKERMEIRNKSLKNQVQKMNEEIVKQVYTILKQYISQKDMQQATDHLVDDLQELLDEEELYRLAGLDKNMKALDYQKRNLKCEDYWRRESESQSEKDFK